MCMIIRVSIEKKLDDSGIKPSDIRSNRRHKKAPIHRKSRPADNYRSACSLNPLTLSSRYTHPQVLPETHCRGLHQERRRPLERGHGPFSYMRSACIQRMYCRTHMDTVSSPAAWERTTAHSPLAHPVIPISGREHTAPIDAHEGFRQYSATCTPSYALHMAEEAPKLGFDPLEDERCASAVHGAGPWTHEIQARK